MTEVSVVLGTLLTSVAAEKFVGGFIEVVTDSNEFVVVDGRLTEEDAKVV